MSRKFTIGSAFAAAALCLSLPVLSAGDDGFSRGRPSTGLQSSEPVQPSQYLSGSGDVRQGPIRSDSSERAGGAVGNNSEPRFSIRSAESDRLIDNPEKRHFDSAVERGRSESVRSEAGVSGRGTSPRPFVQER